jgi:molybdopterin molybdotransferase
MGKIATDISVAQAESLIHRAGKPFPTVSLPLSEAVGRVLREPIKADRPLPPFDRVTMDGVALSFATWKRGCREFKLEGVQRAGMPALRRRSPIGCIEVMTGAVTPVGCDCVVPVEQIETRDGWVRIRSANLQRGDSIHPAGSDAKKGTVLLPVGKVLDGPAVAVAASVGKASVRVGEIPRFAIVSTGDELVEVHERPKPYQIRRSNPHALAASLRMHGLNVVTMAHVTDDRDRQEKVLGDVLACADTVLITGGVSKGRYDFIPETLARLGVKPVFHRVRQRPGRPMWFGVGRKGQLVFGLPGNPASCMVCLHRYLMPSKEIELAQPVARGGLTLFQPIRNGAPVAINTSGDFADLAKSDGFVEIPPGTGHIRHARYWSWQ